MKFIPTFTGTMLVSEQKRIEKIFENIYQDNKKYFDYSFTYVTASVNETNFGMAGFVLAHKQTPAEIQQHIEKIRQLINIALKK